MAYLQEELELVKSKTAVVSEVLVFAFDYGLLASFEKWDNMSSQTHKEKLQEGKKMAAAFGR